MHELISGDIPSIGSTKRRLKGSWNRCGIGRKFREYARMDDRRDEDVDDGASRELEDSGLA